jgi:hypothetical protein
MFKSDLKEFEFENDGQKFFCSVEVPRQQGMSPWWWFRLDASGTTRYAPFEASPSDTKQSVRTRIIAFYAELRAIETRPAYQRPAWKKPERPAANVVTDAPQAPFPPAV